jgi:hypothetical protein
MRGLYRFGYIVGLLVLIQTYCKAQTATSDSIIPSKSLEMLKKNNSVFFELGGAGLYYSLGYERTVFRDKTNHWCLFMSLDAAYYGKIKTGILRSPFHMMSSLNISATYGKRHKAEVELGWVIGADFDVPLSELSQQLHDKVHGGGYDVTFTTLNTFGLGYRFEINDSWGIRSKPQVKFKYDIEFKEWQFGYFWMDIGTYYKFADVKRKKKKNAQ